MTLFCLSSELQAIENGELDFTCGLNSLDRERSLLNDDPKWLDTTYVLANYKTEPCKKPPRLCRQGYACPQYHNNKDKRRSPKKFKYRYGVFMYIHVRIHTHIVRGNAIYYLEI